MYVCKCVCVCMCVYMCAMKYWIWRTTSVLCIFYSAALVSLQGNLYKGQGTIRILYPLLEIQASFEIIWELLFLDQEEKTMETPTLRYYSYTFAFKKTRKFE